LAGYGYPKLKSPGLRFGRFIKDYFAVVYRQLASDLWNFRNGMIHGFCPRSFVLTHHHSQVHLAKSKQGSTILNAEDMYAVLLDASKRFFAELEASAELERAFLDRLEDKEGGNVAVGAVEVS
jgi:hypothetical protein